MSEEEHMNVFKQKEAVVWLGTTFVVISDLLVAVDDAVYQNRYTKQVKY